MYAIAVKRLVEERDMWRMEAALWSHNKKTVLPDGWEHGLDGIYFDDEFVFIKAGDLRVRRGGTGERYNTWAEAMQAAEAVSQSGGQND